MLLLLWLPATMFRLPLPPPTSLLTLLLLAWCAALSLLSSSLSLGSSRLHGFAKLFCDCAAFVFCFPFCCCFFCLFAFALFGLSVASASAVVVVVVVVLSFQVALLFTVIFLYFVLCWSFLPTKSQSANKRKQILFCFYLFLLVADW